MGFVVFILSMVIVIGMFTLMDNAIVRYRKRCEQLKAYIRFLETSHLIEDAHDGAKWIEERAHHRMECDIQDVTYN